jgi:hypothetical protein
MSWLPNRWRRRITIIRTAMREPTLFNQPKEFFMKRIFRNTEDERLFHLFMFQRREL